MVAQDDEAEMDRITSLQYNNMCRVGSWMTLLNFIKVGGDVERGPQYSQFYVCRAREETGEYEKDEQGWGS